MEYRGITYEKYKGRYMVSANRDLLRLGMRTPKTLQQGHKGYLKESTLKKKIDSALAR